MPLPLLLLPHHLSPLIRPLAVVGQVEGGVAAAPRPQLVNGGAHGGNDLRLEVEALAGEDVGEAGEDGRLDLALHHVLAVHVRAALEEDQPAQADAHWQVLVEDAGACPEEPVLLQAFAVLAWEELAPLDR